MRVRLSNRLSPRRPRLRAGAAWFVPLVLVGAAATPPDPGAPGPGPAADVPQQVMAQLRAANEARGQLLRERQAWELERAKLALLAGAVQDEAGRLAAEARAARQAETDLRARAADLQARRERLELVEAALDALAGQLTEALDAVAVGSLPGLVPPSSEAAGEGGGRLAAATRRLDGAERQARKAGIELVVGVLGGDTATVKLLRAGGAAAWWMSLDGSRAGTAERERGRLVLRPARGRQDAEAVMKAFAIVEGRAAPDWVLLPMHHVRMKQGAR